MPININGTTGISGADGSAATPAIQGADTNTGIFFPTADTVAVATGGTERVRVDSSGNVGIGTSSPSGKLNVQDAVAAGRANITLLNNAAGNTSNRMRIRMAASSGFSGTDLYPYIEAYEENAANAAEGLAFGTYNGSSLSERMRIDSSGNVGIGTASPLSTSQLTVASKSLSVTGSDGNFSSGGARTFVDLAGTLGRVGVLDGGAASATSLAFFTGSGSGGNAERARIDASGNLLVGTTSVGDHKLVVSGASQWALGLAPSPYSANGNVYSFIVFRKDTSGGTGVGSITSAGTSTAYNTTSDYRLKENVQPMVGALEKVSMLKPVTYTWKEDGSSGQGFIAHELQAVAPECVTGAKDAVDEDGNPMYQGIDTSFLVATLTAAIQELKAIVDAQAVEIAALKGAA